MLPVVESPVYSRTMLTMTTQQTDKIFGSPDYEGLRYFMHHAGLEPLYLLGAAILIGLVLVYLFGRVAWEYQDRMLRYTSMVGFVAIVGFTIGITQFITAPYYPHALLTLNGGLLVLCAWIYVRYYTRWLD